MVCFFIAMIFWVFTSLSRNYESVISIPVSYKNIPFTRNLQGELPQNLEFHFKGTGFQLFATHIRKRPDSVIVDIGSQLDKSPKLKLSTIAFRNQFPGEPKAFKVTPEIIAPDLTNRAGKRIPVLFQSKISFRNRYNQLGHTIISPDSVDLSGPDSLLNSITSISTENIIINDVARNVFGSVRLTKTFPPGIVVSNPYVYYYISVEEYTEGTVAIPIDLPVSQRSRVTLIPHSVTVTYMAPVRLFNAIRPTDFKVSTEVPFPDMPQRLELQLKKYPLLLKKVRLEPELVDYLIHE
jgi:hypothetical protein